MVFLNDIVFLLQGFSMKFVRFKLYLAIFAVCISLAPVFTSSVFAQATVLLDQGSSWQRKEREQFYSQDQGSWIIPYAWIVALNEPNGLPFMRDSLSRYGYLPNVKNVKNPEGLPIGFLVAKSDLLGPQLSMTCSACHTRQLTVAGTHYIADGGPSFTDLQSFIQDLDAAVGYILASPYEFSQFQLRVSAQLARNTSHRSATPIGVPSYQQVMDWYVPWHTITSRSFTSDTPAWGIGRTDALSLIGNRVSGLDIGSPTHAFLIPENIGPAFAPVRFPFLWNAPRQDLTQWGGTSVNGNDSYALQRNSGEVLGVFALLQPKPDSTKANGYNFLSTNSTNYDGLREAENLVRKIGPPKWPFNVDSAKAARGKIIYDATCGPGCHEIKQGAARPPVTDTWATPKSDVNTDTRYYDVLARTTQSSGLLTGFVNPVNPQGPLPATGAATLSLVTMTNESALKQLYPNIDLTLRAPSSKGHVFESRVLQGVWAAAPYLHNGSVPSLAELLKRAKDRVKNFQVGPNYDVVNVGIAPVQPGGTSTTRVTTDCLQNNTANSNCGHEFGVELTPSEKDALLEYLKTL